jgi:hypothetical protein
MQNAYMYITMNVILFIHSRTWTGGQRYALMTINGISSNDTKYQETKFEYCTYSVLTIKSFDQTVNKANKHLDHRGWKRR